MIKFKSKANSCYKQKKLYKFPIWFKYALPNDESNNNKINLIYSKYNCIKLFFNDIESSQDTFIHSYTKNEKFNNHFRIENNIKNFYNIKINIYFKEKVNLENKKILKEIILSWFLLGSYGAYSTEILEEKSVTDSTDQRSFEYENQSGFHSIDLFTFKNNFCTLIVNLGAVDDYVINILLNSLRGFNVQNDCIEFIKLH
ncbi:hypothetical protein BNATCHR374 (nucleomorph) [Bigelowiella natans]|uniref:Uncharacterized protein n=1 Tax=Bigelowiella natans TaxID=227086 RepID=Q3LVX4_BIGNA|nr:hypothetical protein BNATCHR374 [Bigelowiella natans]ABA27391.1 hypothetical protein [Bigelowiella natans]